MENAQDNRKFGLIGRDISYSFSKGFFAEKFQNEKRDATYVNFDCATVSAVQEVLTDTSVSGYNVTIPYKQDVIEMLDSLDKDAQAIGAVNTIKRHADGSLTGHNTDFIGFKNSLLEQIPTGSLGGENVRALILGTGGASKGVRYALEGMGVHCQYISRKRIAKTNDHPGTLTYDDLNATLIKEAKLIVNCTPVGTYPDVEKAPSFLYDAITEKHIMYDLIYNPSETRFLKEGKQRGALICNGLRMLELQAEASWRIWQNT